MKTKHRKWLVVIASLMVIISVVFVLYIKTDLFKTKEQLFWKYALREKDEIVEIWSNSESQKYNSKLKKSSYIKEGNISLTFKNEIFSPINIKIFEKGNKKEEYKNILIDLEYKNKNYGETTIIKDDDYYLINNNLFGDDYVGFENNDLKQLASNIGINNTEVIPNKIKEIDYFELFYVDNDELNRILKKYVPICRKYINNKDYIKNDDERSDLITYELQLSKKRLNDLLINVLNELKDDQKTLELISNKIKMVDEDNKYCDVENLQDKIMDMKEFFEEQEADDEKFLSIIIYKNKNDVEKIELVFKNDRKLSIEKYRNNKLVIKQYDVDNKQIKIKNISQIFKTIVNHITEITYEKEINGANTNKVDINVVCDIGVETFNLNYNYIEEIKNNVDNIIRKDDVQFIDLKKYDVDEFKDKALKALKNKE